MRGSKKVAKQQAKQAQHKKRYTVEVMPSIAELVPVMASLPMTDEHRARVIDLYTGQMVYGGTEDLCRQYAEQWNSGNPQQFAAWQQLANALLEQQMQDRRRPWRIETNQADGANVISYDDHLIVTVNTAEMAEWIVQMVNGSDG